MEYTNLANITNMLNMVDDLNTHQLFVDKLCEKHNVFLSFIGNDYYILLKNHIITPDLKIKYVKYIDPFNTYQYIIRDSLNVTEIENAMSYNKLFVDTTFQDNPKFAEYLTLKIELLGYNKIDYVKNYAAGCYNFDLDTNFKINDYIISEDEKAYFNNICDIDYEPELFPDPFQMDGD